MSNRKLGNSFESELCEILFNHGFGVITWLKIKRGNPPM